MPVTFFTRVKKVTKETTPRFAAHCVGALAVSETSGAAQLALARHTHRALLRSSNIARLNPRSFLNHLRRRTGDRVVCMERPLAYNRPMLANLDLFAPSVPEERLHPQFRALRSSPFHGEARALMNALYERMGKPNKTFIRHFQSDGFHSHLFEIACFAYLESAGLNPVRTHSSPDFMASRDGINLAIEVTTANPPENQGADITAIRMEELTEWEIVHKENIEFPRRIISILKKKLWSQYDKLPQCSGKPIVLMVAPFFEAGSVFYPDEALVDCIYGINEKTNGFFSLPNSETISAIIYCNAFTVPRFFRLATPLNATAELIAIRQGQYYAVGSDGELSILEYQYRVGSVSSPKESWSEGVTLFLNPNALIPVSQEILPNTSFFSVQDGYLVREVHGFHPLNSFMHVYPRNPS